MNNHLLTRHSTQQPVNFINESGNGNGGGGGNGNGNGGGDFYGGGGGGGGGGPPAWGYNPHWHPANANQQQPAAQVIYCTFIYTMFDESRY